MSQEPPQISILDARLAEIDRRLRTIQTGLAEDAAPPAAGAEQPTPPGKTEPPASGAPRAAPEPAAPVVPEPRAHVASERTASTGSERPAPRPSPEHPVAPGSELHPRVAVPEPDERPRARARARGAAGEEASELVASLRELAGVHERLLDSMRGLLAAYERVLARSLPLPRPAAATSPAPAQATSPGHVTVSAGPFASTDAVRGFERTLAGMPGVREVEVRGYEGGDRAIVDVHLIDPTS
jgi:hypothetical protein